MKLGRASTHANAGARSGSKRTLPVVTIGPREAKRAPKLPLFARISPQISPKGSKNWVRFGFNWVRFDVLKNADFITTYVLVLCYIKFKLGSFRKKTFLRRSLRFCSGRYSPVGERSGPGAEGGGQRLRAGSAGYKTGLIGFVLQFSKTLNCAYPPSL